jgi:acyl-CoA synthetase (AMP-forming)/AMP-acid ligase II
VKFKTDKLLMVAELGLAIWRSGLPRLSLGQVAPILAARWRCGNSFALLSTIAAIRFGSRTALQDDDGAMTFAQLQQQSLALANRLSVDFGVGPGRQVALVGRNHRGFIMGLLACTRLGADVLPLAADLPTAVLEKILGRQNISLLLHDPDLGEQLASAAPGVARTTFAAPWTEGALEPKRVARGGELIVLTSGTSGISKGIRRRPTLGQVVPLVAGLLRSLPLRMHRPVVLAIPLYHGYGIATLAMALALGAPLQLGRRYEIAPLLGRLSPHEQPFLVTVPTLLARWLRENKLGSPPALAAIITGSAPLDAALCTELLNTLGPVLFNLYGSTEAGLIALANPETLRQAPGCVGLPLPGNQVRLLNPGADAVDPITPRDPEQLRGSSQTRLGQMGRISVKGPFVLPSEEDGWRETGDLGYLDGAGNLFVCGRVDAMIVSGGENVYPQEIETVLASHPSVAEVAVLVVDDAEFGRRLEAVVALLPEVQLDEAALRHWLKNRLERHKIPRALHIVETVPRNALGKLDRVTLDRLLEGRTTEP